jgi:hypothetical protein
MAGTETGSASEVNVRLAEFQALRAEIERRSNAQQALLALNLTVSGSLAGIVASDGLDQRLLIVVAFASATFGVLWLDNHLAIKELGIYIRDELWMWAPSWEQSVNDLRPGWWRLFFAAAVMLSFVGVSLAAAIAVAGQFHGYLLVLWTIAVGMAVLTALALGSELLLQSDDVRKPVSLP